MYNIHWNDINISVKSATDAVLIGFKLAGLYDTASVRHMIITQKDLIDGHRVEINGVTIS